MASINKITVVSKSFNLLYKSFSTLNLNTVSLLKQNTTYNSSYLCAITCRNTHTTTPVCGLMDFFDDKKNWGENEVKSGRSWKLDELRIKSNSDLHKLWYVLLKEKNMLLTMEYECEEKAKLFPSPERLDKVNESMTHIETVVKERNNAYHMLETGVSGERPKEVVTNQLGLRSIYRQSEHLIPKEINTAWKTKHNFNARGHAVKKFLSLYREKIYNEKRKKRNRDVNHVIGLLKRFPNMDMDALKSQYPDVDIEKCKNSPKARGHFIPE